MTARRIAVVGGGIFGVTCAVKLADCGHAVEVFEKHRDLLMGASGINQYRLHRGYHYPRSPETAVACREAEASFRQEYGEAVLDGGTHHYGIAKRNSLIQADRYMQFCDTLGLAYEREWTPLMRRDAIDLCLRVQEGLFDPDRLRAICWRNLRRAKVSVRLETAADEKHLAAYDVAVVCTYSTINTLLRGRPDAQKPYQFELCEKPVVRLPRRFAGKSLVILDGPFMCIDPFGSTELFVLGNVVHAIHHTHIGTVLEGIDERYHPLIDNGVIPHPPLTHIERFIESAAECFNGIERAEHVGSMFTIRAVYPYRDHTDERPTIVERVSDRLITVFSGKIGTCVQAAMEVVALVGGTGQTERTSVQAQPRAVSPTPAG